jgi:hypothetical protein
LQGINPFRLDTPTLHVSTTNSLDQDLIALSGLPSYRGLENFSIFYDDDPAVGEGVYRDWLIKFGRKVFSSDLFVLSGNGKYSLKRDSQIDKGFLWKYRIIGRWLGLMIVEGMPIGVEMARSVYDVLLGKEVFTINDVEDEQMLNTFVEMLKCKDRGDCGDLMLTFESIDGRNLRDPDTDGSSEEVSASNIDEYVDVFIQDEIYNSRKEIFNELYRGFHQVIPLSMLMDFLTPFELTRILAGVTSVDIDELREKIFVDDDDDIEPNLIEWFWRFIADGESKRAMQLVHFVTGLTSLPVGGVADLPRIRLNVVDYWPNRPMPKAHLCYHTIDLPNYTTEAELRERLGEAIVQTELGVI